MEEKIIANSEQLYCIARELETVHGSLRKMECLLAENNEMCNHLGFVGVESAASEFERTIQETIRDYHKLWSKLVLSSEQYMKMMKTGIPIPPSPLFLDFEF